MKMHTLLGSLAVAASLTALPAHAESASSLAEITGLTFQLFDLNPGDGIAPAITFGNNAGGVNLTTFIQVNGDYKQFDTLYHNGQVQASYWSSTANAIVSDTQVRAAADVVGQSGTTSGWSSASTNLFFELTPYTGVMFNAAASLLGQPATLQDNTYATIAFRGWLNSTVNNVSGQASFLRSEALGQGDESFQLLGYLYTDGFTGNGRVELLAHATAAAAPVPEPASYAMLAVGMLVAGAAARQRKRSC